MRHKQENIERANAVGQEALLDLFEREHALVWPEVEAKLSEKPHPDPEFKYGINPHVLTRVRTNLVKEGVIEQTVSPTRGGRNVEIWSFTDKARKARAVEDAAARKRLLHGRYLTWTTTSKKAPNMIGEAGERVVRTSVREAGEQASYLFTTKVETTSLFGETVPGGPLDDSAYLTVIGDNSMPVAVTLAIEVKNIRHWIYPSSQEIYQLLDKCARIQTKHPGQPLVPILVCRRAHFTAFKMAKDLGVFMLEMREQPILPRSEVDPNDMQEVVNELGYNLVRTDEALPRLVHEFRGTLPNMAARSAARWANNGPALSSLFSTLREQSLSPQDRTKTLEELRKEAKKLPDVAGGW